MRHPEQALLVDIGDGGNGKSLLYGIVGEDILGRTPAGYSTEIPVEALLASKGERHPTELMPLWGARLALARESGETTYFNEGRVKTLTGGDPIQARYMRQDYITFDPTHIFVVFGNGRPRLRGAAQAAWRRRLQMTIYPQRFGDRAIPERDIILADRQLREKLRGELPGILYRLIQGCLEYQRIGLCPPDTVRHASEEYLREENLIAQFLDERCDRSEECSCGSETCPCPPRSDELKPRYATVTANELWSELKSWAAARKRVPGGRMEFNSRLEDLGIRVVRSHASRGVCHGIALKDWRGAGA